MGDDPRWLDRCLDAIPRGRVTVFGDFCLDAYWFLDPDQSELSVETHLPIRRVRDQRYSLGGAGNVVANLAALGVGRVRAVSLVGQDLFGREMRAILEQLGVDASGLLAAQPDWQTMVFAKPHLGGTEQNRIDFGGCNRIAAAGIEALERALAAAAADSDVVILNQQVPAGVSTPAMIERLNALIAAFPACRFIVDSRHRPELYRGCLHKINAHETARLLGSPQPLDRPVEPALADELARRLWQRTRKSVFVTRGRYGVVAVDEAGRITDVPGIRVLGPIDSVGAGDTAVSAVAAALAAGQDASAAARLANIAAAITVQKLHTTGTASPAEIRSAGPSPEVLPERSRT